MNLRALLGKESLLRLTERPLVSLALWVALPLLFIFVFGDELSGIYRRVSTLAIVYFLIAAVLVVVSRDSIRASFRFDPRSLTRCHWGWVLVGLAVVLRFALLEFLPPEFPINIEEIQLGGNSMKMLLGDELPVPYRFTVIMASISFVLVDNTLDGLRIAFKLAGGISIVLMALTLRRLSVGWPATLLAVFVMSSLSLFVAVSGLAYENFSGITFEVLLLYCFACAVTSRDNALVWAGFAGIVGGVLLHEWVCYPIIAGLPPMFWFAQAVLSKDADCRRAALRSGGVYIALITLTGASALSDMLNDPSNTLLLDPILRHAGERSGVSPDVVSYLANSGKLLLSYAQALFGLNPEFPSPHFRLSGSERVIPLLTGAVFGLSVIYALSGRAGLFAWNAAVMLLILLVGVSFLSNNYLLDRIGSTLPIVVLLGGIAVDSVLKRFSFGEQGINSLWKNPLVYSTLLTGMVLAVNVIGTIGMSSDEEVLREFQNHQYVACLTIAQNWREFEFEQARLYGGLTCNKNDDIWLYPNMEVDIDHSYELVEDIEIESGTLLVLSKPHGLENDRIDEFVALSSEMGSSHTLRINENLLGDVAAMSFCHQCEKRNGVE